MKSQPATMASSAGATRLHRSLPEEIVVWEILVRLPPKPLLRCRAVCRAWRHTTSARPFLEAHHGRQPSLPVVSRSKYSGAQDFLAFDHHAAAGACLQPVVRLKHSFYLTASCEGLLILSNCGIYSVCNPATRQHAPLRQQLLGFRVLGMYKHRPTGEYRLLLHPTHKSDCYVYALGSNQPLRYVGVLEVAGSPYLHGPTLVRHSLHWYWSDSYRYQGGNKYVIVFDTASEWFRQMRAPDAPAKSYTFEMDGALGLYSHNGTTQIVDVWMLRNYESEVWMHEYSIKLPAAEIKRFFRWFNDDWHVTVHSVDGDVLLLVTHDAWMFYVDTDGKLVDAFHRDGQHISAYELRLKQTLVPQAFFTALQGYAVNASPFL